MLPRQNDGVREDSQLSTRLMQCAVSALEARRPIEALPSLDRLRLLPGHAGIAAALRAEALLALGRSSEADAAADEALRECPDDPTRLELRARAHLACGRRIEALDGAAAAVMAAPDSIAALLLFACLLAEERRFDEAIQVLEETLRRHPGNSQARLRLGIVLMKAGRHDAADQVLRRCLIDTPKLPGLAAARAQAALARRSIEEAIAIARLGLQEAGADAALYSALAHALETAGQREEAWSAFRAAARLAPDDPYLAHMAAIADGIATERASAGYVESVFDGYAASFEQSLIRLGYRVPGLIRRAIERHRPGPMCHATRIRSVLDLGCGTGLVGVAIHDLMQGCMIGVDLSRRMLELARSKEIYTELRQVDLFSALESSEARFDLITAADVFCYLGRLDRVLALCASRLAPGGLLIFSVERGASGSGYRLHKQGRYEHAPDLVRADLAAAALSVLDVREGVLRHDFGRPVDGLVVVAARAG